MNKLVGILIVALHSIINCGDIIASDTLRYVLPDSSVFKGVLYKELSDSSSLLYGGVKTKDFRQLKGYFYFRNDVLSPSFVRMANAAGDTIYSTISRNYEDVLIKEQFSPSFYMLSKELIAQTGNNLIIKKYYKPDEDEWIISNSFENDQNEFGRSYDASRNRLYDVSDSRFEDKMFTILLFIIMLSMALWIIFGPITGEKHWQIKSVFTLTISIAIIILLSMLTELDIKDSLLLPLFSLVVPAVIYLYLLIGRGAKGPLLAYGHVSLCLVILSCWSYYLFFNLDEMLSLSDNSSVAVHWKAGTPIAQRTVVRQLFSNMVPVGMNSNGTDYVVYVNKYELSEGEFAVLNNDNGALLSYWNDDGPLNSLSYRESQILLSVIHNICGVRLDFLSYSEWQTVACKNHHDINNGDFHDVTVGDINEIGLVNVSGNIPEYTSDYEGHPHINLDADSLIKAMDYIMVAGNAYQSDYQVDSSFVHKNFKEGSVGLRFAFRPDNIGQRKFGVIARLRSQYNNNDDYPKIIVLKSINDVIVKSFSSYEDFEEKLIESRFRGMKIDGYDVENHFHQVVISMPSGLGFYEYSPSFYFYGIKDDDSEVFERL